LDEVRQKNLENMGIKVFRVSYKRRSKNKIEIALAKIDEFNKSKR
jgi:hypothetical protein